MDKAILVLSGLDPCAGAGISADIETISHFGISALPVITTLTVQNTESVAKIQPVDSELISQQLCHLRADIEIKFVKIGLLSSAAQIKAIAQFLQNMTLTIVLDPIVKSSSKNTLLPASALPALRQYLLPLVDILTPNLAELSVLSDAKSEQQKVASLAVKWVLVTTTDAQDIEIEHRLYKHGNLHKSYTYKKLSGNYHGSGCTLSSAIVALIAQGLLVENACQKALDYTYQTLLSAKSIGKMQKNPNRNLL
ncbi:MAG: hydroxymethylpyrimidine/phosphomethylpyrimidine kinase [Candidatus Thioglobus sp.]|nr:MAG: hydroxymethylpyrimidine/phosphomethylpyrimidine kinase [Candidatus Thioglobus sp.]